MATRYVTLGDGRPMRLGGYVNAWCQCRALPADTWIGRGISGFGETAEEALRQLRGGMHDRINRHLPWYGRGRKWCPDWQRGATQCANAVNTPRLIVRWVPRDLRDRLQHRISFD